MSRVERLEELLTRIERNRPRRNGSSAVSHATAAAGAPPAGASPVGTSPAAPRVGMPAPPSAPPRRLPSRTPLEMAMEVELGGAPSPADPSPPATPAATPPAARAPSPPATGFAVRAAPDELDLPPELAPEPVTAEHFVPNLLADQLADDPHPTDVGTPAVRADARPARVDPASIVPPSQPIARAVTPAAVPTAETWGELLDRTLSLRPR